MQKIEELMLLCTLLGQTSQEEIAALRERVLCDKIPWVGIIALANSDYLVPALYGQLKNKKLFEVIQDEQLKGYMREVYAFNTERNYQILDQLKHLASLLIPLGSAPLLLKGSAILTEGDYPSFGMRCMTDIDIMLDKKELGQTLEVLKRSGYSFVNGEEKHQVENDHHHLEAMQKDGMPAALELHYHAVGGKASEYIIQDCDNMQKSTNKNFKELDILLPTYRLYHAFLHTEIQHKNHKFKSLGLRHLYDFTVLTTKYKEEIDWKLLRQLAVSNHCKEVLDDYLYLANMLFSLHTPLTVENSRTRRHYKMVLKSFELKGTFLGQFYPLRAKLESTYSYKKLQKRYIFNSVVGYIVAVFKHSVYLLRKYFLKEA